MPKQYEAIRDNYIQQGMSATDAKTRAAKIFIAKGKGGSRSTRAKSLHSDKPKGKTAVMPAKDGKPAIKFHEGGLHSSTGTPQGQKISPAKHKAAASGELGPKAAKQEAFYQNVLHH